MPKTELNHVILCLCQMIFYAYVHVHYVYVKSLIFDVSGRLKTAENQKSIFNVPHILHRRQKYRDVTVQNAHLMTV